MLMIFKTQIIDKPIHFDRKILNILMNTTICYWIAYLTREILSAYAHMHGIDVILYDKEYVYTMYILSYDGWKPIFLNEAYFAIYAVTNT